MTEERATVNEYASATAVPFCVKEIVLRRESESGAISIPKMVVTSDGTLLIVAQARDGGDWGSRIDPVYSRSTDGGNSWSRPCLLVPEDFPGRDESLVKPTGIVVDRISGRIIVFVSRSPLRNRDGAQINEVWFYTHLQETHRLGRAWFVVTSDDDGQSWSEPREITRQLIKQPHWQEWSPVHTGFQLQFGAHRGRLVVPVRCYCPEHDPSEYSLKYQHNGMLYSDDGGATWIPGGRSDPCLGECSIAERADGSVYVNHRTSRDPSRRSERMHNSSVDGGVTFTECTYAEIPDERCHAGLTVLTEPSGRRLFLLSSIPGSKRDHLTIRVSENEGETWNAGKVIEPGFAGYSDLAVLPDGTIVCVYETGEREYRQHLAVARFNTAWLNL